MSMVLLLVNLASSRLQRGGGVLHLSTTYIDILIHSALVNISLAGFYIYFKNLINDFNYYTECLFLSNNTLCKPLPLPDIYGSALYNNKSNVSII